MILHYGLLLFLLYSGLQISIGINGIVIVYGIIHGREGYLLDEARPLRRKARRRVWFSFNVQIILRNVTFFPAIISCPQPTISVTLANNVELFAFDDRQLVRVLCLTTGSVP